MVTRQQMDETGRRANGLMDLGFKDQALMAWIDALGSDGGPTLEAWTQTHINFRRTPGGSALIVVWQDFYVQGAPTFTVFEHRPAVGSEPAPLPVRHDFHTALAAATFIVTGRDVNARPLAYQLFVHEPGKVPEVEPEEVHGIDEALDRLVEELALTTGGPVIGPLASERETLRETGKLVLQGSTPDHTLYHHVIERMF